MYHAFLNALPPDEVFRVYIDAFRPCAPSTRLPSTACLGRPLARDYTANQDLPGFRRSTVDGFAVRAEDTFGAGESNPIYLKIEHRIAMGELPSTGLSAGSSHEIPTGGALPEGADAVVMVEFTDLLADDLIGIQRPVAPGENVVQADEDVPEGELVLRKGHLLRPQDLGLLAALGVSEIEVFTPLDIALFSTGDELVPVEESPCPAGRVRNVNSILVRTMLEAAGHKVDDRGIVIDDFDALFSAVSGVVDRASLVLISGGSSAGARDFTCRVIESLPGGSVDVHGIRISPGKPTIMGRAGETPVIGLPGHPVSCAVIVDRFVKPLLRLLAGEYPYKTGPLRFVTLSENIESRPGREEYVRVRLEPVGNGFVAHPVRGPSGAVSTLVKAHGVVRIPLESEGVRAGSELAFFDLNG